jgi:hypothetical protein
MEVLGKAQTQTRETNAPVYISIAGVEVSVPPRGVGFKHGQEKMGIVYKYRLDFDGISLYIHSNIAPKNIQPIRFCYHAESLIPNELSAVHQCALNVVNALGFTVKKETLTRADAQVIVPIPVVHLVDLIGKNHLVTKLKVDHPWRECGRVTGYESGAGDVQVKMYDKRIELKKKANQVKKSLMIRHAIGNEWWHSNRPITRIEIKLGRDALKHFRVNTVAELQEREQGIIDIITTERFRLLAKPKVKGHESKAALHPDWIAIREAFFQGFTGNAVQAEWKKPESLSCDAGQLKKQAAGCLAKAAELEMGKQNNTETRMFLSDFSSEYSKAINAKANEGAEHTEIVCGITLGQPPEYDVMNTIDSDILEQTRERRREEFDNPTLRLR